MKSKAIKNLTLSAMFVAIGILLPFLTASNPKLGQVLLPMHIPVFLCALICGWQYGLSVGAIVPLMRSLIIGMPMLFPEAVAMTFELAAYGFIAGFLYHKSKHKCIISLYCSMIIAMLGGRIVLALADYILYWFDDKPFVFKDIATVTFVKALPGIVLQLILIPAIMFALGKTKMIKFDGFKGKKAA